MTLTTGNKTCYPLGGELEIYMEDFIKPEVKDGFTICSNKYSLWLDTGRSAIYAALLSILSQGGKREAWLPRYCCPSVELPFTRLGFKLNFYSLGGDLASPIGLPAQLDGETVLFIHYFGKRNLAMHKYLREMKKQYTFFVIEDCVQALLNNDLGTFDYAVYSFRKFLHLPDGAVVCSRYPLEVCRPEPADEAFVSRRLIGKLIRRHSGNTSFLGLFAAAENIIDDFKGPREASFLSKYLLTRADAVEIAAKRRRNFFYLTAGIRQICAEELIRPLFSCFECGEVPLGLPVCVNPVSRDNLRTFLAKQGIYCAVHWPLMLEERWSEELQLSQSLLTLPVDQRMEQPELDFLLEKVGEFCK